MRHQYLRNTGQYSIPERINLDCITLAEIAQCNYLIHSRNELYEKEQYFQRPDRDANEMYLVQGVKGDALHLLSMAGNAGSFRLQDIQNDGYWWSITLPQFVKDKIGRN